MFFFIVIGIWSLLHAYVGWRLAGVPWVAAHLSPRTLTSLLLLLWLSFPATRLLAATKAAVVGRPLELVGATWVGVLFLLFVALLATDALTLGGWLLPRLAPLFRGWAALAGLSLSLIALVQGLRPPVVTEYTVALPGLPPERDGLTLVVLSDLHLGSLIGEGWLADLVSQVDNLHPDLVVLAGDLVDSDLGRAEPLRPALQRLHAPLGVWAVLGNHDVYAGADGTARFAESAGITVLRNRAVGIVPGLRLAGIDDPATFGRNTFPDRRLAEALAPPTAGATILLAHSPDAHTAEEAAAAGIGLMLSGHTHGGQIWPFGELVRRRYPLFTGRYEVAGMTVLIGRGAGTWGPRMRLWRPGEILRIRLITAK
jgi:predicted MPP superfamily phosphohydrolase